MTAPDALHRTLTWAFAASAIVGMVVRPWRMPEWCWPVAAAVGLVVVGSLGVDDAVRAAAGGWDVYLFIGGMMLLAELARAEGFFDHVATRAVGWARGSQARLFAIVYAIGALVTVFMSNDATAVVLTPAIAAAARHARVKPLPHLFACAFVANAASFALPISNPANLVVFDGALPGLAQWVRDFGWASAAATPVTYAALRWSLRSALAGPCEAVQPQALSRGGAIAAASVAATALAVLCASALSWPLGPATFAAAALGCAVLCLAGRRSPLHYARHVSWSSLLLVAGLFVIVRAIEATGLLAQVADAARLASGRSLQWAAGILAALAGNAMNNLPAAMAGAAALDTMHAPLPVREAVAIGIDLGPNLTVIGSLSTLLWLLAIRREGEAASGWAFFKLGLIATPPALLLALALL